MLATVRSVQVLLFELMIIVRVVGRDSRRVAVSKVLKLSADESVIVTDLNVDGVVQLASFQDSDPATACWDSAN